MASWHRDFMCGVCFVCDTAWMMPRVHASRYIIAASGAAQDVVHLSSQKYVICRLLLCLMQLLALECTSQLQTSTAATPAAGYWTSDKVRWWAVVGVLSVLAFTYERWIDPLMDQVALLKRLGARQLGKQYDEDQTADDITTVLLMQQVQRLEAGQKLGAPTEVELRGEDGQWTSGGATGGMPGGMPGAMPGGGSGSSSSSPGMGMGSSSGAGGSRGSSGS